MSPNWRCRKSECCGAPAICCAANTSARYICSLITQDVSEHDVARNTRASIAVSDKRYAEVSVERIKDDLKPGQAEW